MSDLAYQQLVVRAQEQQRQSVQALSSAKMDVERYQKAIEYSQKRLAELALILSDPTISMRDRQFAVSGQATQLKFLQESQENLKYAQQRLDEPQGSRAAVSAPPQVVSEPSSHTVKSLFENINMDPVFGPSGCMKVRDGSFLHLSNSQ